jgi:hypothetical protein
LQILKIVYNFSNVLSLGSLNIQHYMLQFISNSLNATLKQQEPLIFFSIDLFIYRKPSDMLCVFLYSFIVSYMFGVSLFL